MGIAGFDEITFGGLPRGRPTLVCGGAGCGKTLFAMEFLVRGARDFGEPGVFMSFEETADDLIQNSRSLGFDLPALIKQKRLVLDHVRIERTEITETGAYDLEGLFVRLGEAIASIRAKRVVLDTIEMLFAGLADQLTVRTELARLFRWLKAKGVTAIVTGERARDQLTRHGLEEYVSDCVIVLDQRVEDQTATRRMRIVKYRGSPHRNDEVPFLIDSHGYSVLPITSMGLEYPVSRAVASSGIADLDAMFGKKGFFRGSSVLVSGTSGTGKSSFAAYFAAAAATRGERCLYFAFEEAPDQIVRNMASIGLRLDRLISRGTLRIDAHKPTAAGLESHLVRMQRDIDLWRPRAVVLDPVSNLTSVGTTAEVKAMLSRLIDHMKQRQITAFITVLANPIETAEATEVGVSSLMDVWIMLANRELNGERNRSLQIVKVRGMSHSNQVREFQLGSKGITMVEVSRQEGVVAIGSRRVAREGRTATRRRRNQ